jgi:hypothetical protein
MIKVASNLNTLCVKKSAETQGDDSQTESPKKKRQVDYRGRAQRGAIAGAVPGSLTGGLLGALVAHGAFDRGDQDDKSLILSTILGGALPGAVGGGLLGGATGAGANMLLGLANEDVITQADEPDKSRRGLLGALLGGLGGGAYGTAMGSYFGRGGDFTPLIGGLAGAGLGALGGGLGNAYLGPWLNKDVYSQDYMDKKSSVAEPLELKVRDKGPGASFDVNKSKVRDIAGTNYLLNDALVGGGLGVGLGGSLGLLLEALSNKEEKEYLMSLLKGTVGGGLTGAGLGALTGYLTGAGRKQQALDVAVTNLANEAGLPWYAKVKKDYKQPLIVSSPFSQSLNEVFNTGKGTRGILEAPDVGGTLADMYNDDDENPQTP